MRSIRLSYPLADAMVAISHQVAEDLVNRLEVDSSRVTVIHNPVQCEEIRTEGEMPLDHPWFAPGEPPVILGAGRLASEKDFPTLLKAFALLRKHRPARLMILGEGRERVQLQALARKLDIERDF